MIKKKNSAYHYSSFLYMNSIYIKKKNVRIMHSIKKSFTTIYIDLKIYASLIDPKKFVCGASLGYANLKP